MNLTGEIKYYLGNDYAVLRFTEGMTSFSIEAVSVPATHRKQGVGTTLVKHVLMLADCTGKTISVTTRPMGGDGGERLQRLIRFFERFGFVVQETALNTAYMIRPHQ